MSRKHYLVIFILFVGGVFVSYLLLPHKREIAQMEMRDRHFQEARASYEAELAGGNLSVNVVSQLSSLYLQAGEIEEAIAIMERFVEANPDNMGARQKLGEYYQFAQRSDDYLRNLEEINRRQPQSENVKQLSQIYNFDMQYDKQQEMLKKLTEDEAARKPEHFAELAQLQAAHQNYPAAIETLQKLDATYPEKLGFNEAQLLVTLLYEERRNDEAYKAADEWLKTAGQQPDHGASMIGIVHIKDSPERANQLLTYYTEAQIEASPALKEEAILLQLDVGNEEEAYARLKEVQKKHGLSSNLFSRLLILASVRRDHDLVREVTENIDLTTLTESQLMTLAEFAVVEKDEELLALLTQRFPAEQYGEDYPLLSAALAVGNKSSDAEARLAKIEPAALNTHKLLQMARICAYGENPECVTRFLASLPPQDNLSDGEIAMASNVYLANDEWEKGHGYLTRAMEKRPESPELMLAAVKFDAAKGDTAKVAAWMEENHEMLNLPVLFDLYFISMNRGHADVGILAAREMEKRYPSETSHTLLANAYFKAGWYAQAAELLRPAPGETLSEADESNYIMSLSRIAKRDPIYRKELGDYIGERLKDNPPRKRKIALIYALLDAKLTEEAMPYVRDLAHSEGGQWASLYAETLDKQGKHEEARKFWVQVAMQPSTSAKQKTSIAYDLLARGYRDDAERIFQNMAAKAAPDSQPVSALLYIWGPRLEPYQMAWLTERYETASGSEREAWAKLIAARTSPSHLIELVEDQPSLMNHKDIAASYLEARASEGIFTDGHEEFIEEATEQNRTDLLRAYATTAGNYGYAAESRRANEALLKLNPNDTDAWRDAGLVAFDQADYSASKEYLTQYLSADEVKRAGDPKAYRAYFYYGELLRKEDREEEARRYYQLANALVSDANEERPAPEKLAVQAQSRLRMGDKEGGWQTYRQALDTYPENESLRADFVFSLIEEGRLEEARSALAALHGELSPAAGTSGQLTLPQDVKRYTLLNDGRELLLTYGNPVEKGVAPSETQIKQLPWVSYNTQGYDTMLIVAKPGYRMNVDANGNVPVVSAVQTADATRATEQMEIRYELLRARLDLESGEVYAANERLDDLVEKYPTDSQVLGFAANAENYGGNWPEAQNLITKAHTLAPYNEDIIELDRSMRRLNAPHLKIDHEWLSRGDNDEQITTLSGMTRINDHLQLGGKFVNNYARGENVRRADGRVGNFSDHRQQAEIFLRHHQQPGIQAQLSLFANNDTLGAGGYFNFLNPLGETLLTAEFHRPYWEYTQAVLDSASRDRIAAHHTVRPNTRLTIGGGVSANRYHVEDFNNVRSTFGIDAQVVYRLMDAQPYLALGYGLDGEYELSHKKDFDALGGYTPLFPLQSREIHFLSLAGGWEFSPRTYADGLIGYGYDRLGGHGPAIEARLTHEFTESLDGQIRAYYGIDGTDSDDSLTRLGGYLRWRY